MAKITIDSFRGEVPRLTARALPPNAAQVAINARLQSGDLESWRGMLETASLANDAQTIYLLDDAWLSWESDVDVARGPIAGDTTYRVYLTGPDEYDQPRFTNYALATTGSAPYPVTTRPLGVPGPVSEPTLVIGVDPSPTTFSVDVLDEGDVLDDQWVTSPLASGGGLYSEVAQEASGGNPGSCYRLSYDESSPGAGPYAYRKVDTASATVIHASTDFKFTDSDDGAPRRAGLAVATSVDGVGCAAQVFNGNGLRIVNQANAGGWYGPAVVDSTACPLSHGTWYTLDVVMIVNSNGTQTVTAQVLQGSAQIATVTATSVFTVGDYIGLNAAAGNDAGFRYSTLFDNIHVQASGSNGYTPVNIATSYVYTFVNDLGEESVPSLPSSTIQRPDGVSVTITTATVIPSGISSTYGITTKRIYRAATGNTGTVFRFVAEIDLATETYEDVLTDEQLGEVLESEEYDLPPDDLRGIIALPNGVMAGFAKNQLCLSAQNRPHAWPEGNRLTVDTNIVAIANIDTTVVVGTEKFVYSASGNDPSAYSMSQPGAPQACVAKLSMRYLSDQTGVVFASPDGLMAMTGPTTVRNVTEGVFTRRQWQDLVPETIHAVVHDDIYFFSYGTNSSASGGMYMLDLKASGFGLVRLDYFANAMFSDPLTDKLYLTQTDISTNTVLFLFHMTETATGEGIAEFIGGPTSALDQTDATWTADGTGWTLLGSGPTAKFGLFWLGAESGQSVTWLRDAVQTDPVVPDTVAIGASTALTIDAWVYRGLGASGGVRIRVGAAYPDYFVLNADEFSTQAQMWGGAVFLNDPAGAITEGQWVHLRLTYVGDVLRLFVDGVIAATSASTPGLLTNIDPISTMDVRVENFYGLGFIVDEATAILGTTASSANFTPPVAPWPNP